MKRVSIKNKSKAALFIVMDSYIVDMHYVVSEQVHGCVHWVPIELHVHTHPFGVSHNQLKLVLLHFEVVQNVSVDLCNDEVSVVGQPLPILDGGEGRRTNHVGLRVGTNLLSDIDESCGTPKIIESKHYICTHVLESNPYKIPLLLYCKATGIHLCQLSGIPVVWRRRLANHCTLTPDQASTSMTPPTHGNSWKQKSLLVQCSALWGE